MKPRYGRPWIAFLSLFALACSVVTGLFSGAGSGDLSARATSPVSVRLEWAPVVGAAQYRIDVRVGDSDFFPMAELPAEATDYVDFVAPGTSKLTYRLVAMTDAGEQQVGTATVSMPDLSPNPLVVEVQLFEPIMAAIPTYDPENPMASLPPGFDPENPEAFDPSSLFQMASATQEIGSEGGSLSVTDPNQVSYTLDVPPGAVDEPLVFTLTPIGTIDGFPLSGGLLGAVRIQPEGLEFAIPAILTIEPAAIVESPSAPLTVGFAVSIFSQEFYLYPLASPVDLSVSPGGAGHVASLAAMPFAQGPSSSMAVGRGATYGVGAGSSGDVQKQAQRVPTDSGAQVAQHNAQQQFQRPEAAAASARQTGEAVLLRMVLSDSAKSVAEVASALEQYWQDEGARLNQELNQRLLDQFLKKIKRVFDRAKGDCLTEDDLVAGDMADKLKAESNDFWKAVAQAYRKTLGDAGQKLLDDLFDGKNSCVFTLEITSTVKLESDEGWLRAEVHTATPIQLRPARVENRLSLMGFGSVDYRKFESQVKGCPVAKVTQYPSAGINLIGLFPDFDGQVPARVYDFRLTDFELPTFDLKAGVNITRHRRGCEVTISLFGGGDFWSGMFVLLHYSSGISEWELRSSTYPLVFTKEFKNYTVNDVYGKVTENATYTITIRRVSN